MTYNKHEAYECITLKETKKDSEYIIIAHTISSETFLE